MALFVRGLARVRRGPLLGDLDVELIKRARSIGHSAYAGKTSVLFLGVLEGGLEVAPEGVRVLEPGA